MKNHFKIFIAALFSASFSLSSCDKEMNEFETEKNQSSPNEVLENNPLVIDGKKQEWHFSLKPRKLTKGMILNEAKLYSDYNELLKLYGYDIDDYKLIDTINFTYNKNIYRIKVLRIDRKSEPGKYFYVMIDNLDVQMDTACWAYADNTRNVKKYGRLYTYYSAAALANKITMPLHVYNGNNPTEKLIDSKIPIKARIPSRQDICDIIECNAIGNLPSNGYNITDQYDYQDHPIIGMPMFYYDIFVGGLEGPDEDDNAIDYSRGERILAGFRNTAQQSDYNPNYWDGNGWYALLNKEA